MNYVSNYSYGLAVSACLYRVLDNGTDFNQENIGGCTLLLPCWAWDRIKFLSPSIEPLFTKDIVVGLGFPLEKRLIFYLYSYFLNLKFECILTFVVQIKHILFMKGGLLQRCKGNTKLQVQTINYGRCWTNYSPIGS